MIKKIFCIIVISMIFSLAACNRTATEVTGPEVTDITVVVDAPTITGADGQPVVTESPVIDKPALKPNDPGYVDPNHKIDKVYNNDVTFNIGWDIASIDMSKDAIGRAIQDKFKCKFDLKIMPAEKILLLAAQDQLPDFFRLDLSSTIFKQLEDQKFLYHINRNAVDSYPLLKRYFTSHQYLNAFSDMSYDKQYVGLPFSTSIYSPVVDYICTLYYRKDWARKVGFTGEDKDINTVDKVYQLMKKFREEDPDGNGLKDTYGTSGGIWAFHYITWVDITSWGKETNPSSEFYGKYVPGFVNTKMFDAITWWNRLIQEQIMPADFNLQPIMQSFIANKAGISYGNAGDYWRWEFLVNRFDASHKDLYPKLPKINDRMQTVADVVGELPPLKPDENSPARFPYFYVGSITAISAKAGEDKDKIERIFDFYEWTMTQEGADFLNFGTKGVDYKVDSNGEIIRTLPNSTVTPGATKKIWEVYPSVQIGSLVSWGGTTPSKEKVSLYPQWIVDRQLKTQPVKNAATVMPTIAINNIMTETKVNHLDMFNDLWFEDKLSRIIAQDGGKTIEQGWQDFLTECLDTKEGRKIIDEVNVQIKAKGLG